MLRVNTPVTVTVLGPSPGPAAPGVVADLSGKGLRITVLSPMPCGTPVKVETDELMMLAEVCCCKAVRNGYEAGLMVSEMLSGLSDSRRLSRALLEETRS